MIDTLVEMVVNYGFMIEEWETIYKLLELLESEKKLSIFD